MSNQGRTPGFLSRVSACACVAIAGIFGKVTLQIKQARDTICTIDHMLSPPESLVDAALPALLAARVISAVESAQRAARGPVTSAEALAHSSPRVARSPRAFTKLAERVAELEPRLSAAGTDHAGCALWLVEPSAAAPPALTVPADLAARLERTARAHGLPPADALRALLEHALPSIEWRAP